MMLCEAIANAVILRIISMKTTNCRKMKICPSARPAGSLSSGDRRTIISPILTGRQLTGSTSSHRTRSNH